MGVPCNQKVLGRSWRQGNWVSDTVVLFTNPWAHPKSVWICASAPSMHAVITCTAMTKPRDWKSISRGHGRSAKEAGHSTLAITSFAQMKYVLGSCKTKWMSSTLLDRPQRLIQDNGWGYSRVLVCEYHQVQKMPCWTRPGQWPAPGSSV